VLDFVLSLVVQDTFGLGLGLLLLFLLDLFLLDLRLFFCLPLGLAEGLRGVVTEALLSFVSDWDDDTFKLIGLNPVEEFIDADAVSSFVESLVVVDGDTWSTLFSFGLRLFSLLLLLLPLEDLLLLLFLLELLWLLRLDRPRDDFEWLLLRVRFLSRELLRPLDDDFLLFWRRLLLVLRLRDFLAGVVDVLAASMVPWMFEIEFCWIEESDMLFSLIDVFSTNAPVYLDKVIFNIYKNIESNSILKNDFFL